MADVIQTVKIIDDTVLHFFASTHAPELRQAANYADETRNPCFFDNTTDNDYCLSRSRAELCDDNLIWCKSERSQRGPSAGRLLVYLCSRAPKQANTLGRLLLVLASVGPGIGNYSSTRGEEKKKTLLEVASHVPNGPDRFRTLPLPGVTWASKGFGTFE